MHTYADTLAFRKIDTETGIKVKRRAAVIVYTAVFQLCRAVTAILVDRRDKNIFSFFRRDRRACPNTKSNSCKFDALAVDVVVGRRTHTLA